MTIEDHRFLAALLAGWLLGWSWRGVWESTWDLWLRSRKPADHLRDPRAVHRDMVKHQ